MHRRTKSQAREKAKGISQATTVKVHLVLDELQHLGFESSARLECLPSHLSVTTHRPQHHRAGHQFLAHGPRAPIAWREIPSPFHVQVISDTQVPSLRSLRPNLVLRCPLEVCQMILTGHLDLDPLHQPPLNHIRQTPTTIKPIHLLHLKCLRNIFKAAE